MLDQVYVWSSLERISALLLVLAITLPLLGLIYGTARGLPIQLLGGLMIVYWILELSSLIAASIYLIVSDKGGVLFSIAATATTAPIALKVITQKVFEKDIKPVQLHRSNSANDPSTGCRPMLASSNSRQVAGSKRGDSGKVAWLFWIGNHYEWLLEYNIKADDSGITGSASATGTVCAWYSVIVRNRRAIASARGSVDCERSNEHCLSVARPASHFDRDVDFCANVEVRTSESAGLSIIEVFCTADVSGTQGLSSVSAGPSMHGVGVSASLQAPNNARGEIRKSESYTYRCVRAKN